MNQRGQVIEAYTQALAFVQAATCKVVTTRCGGCQGLEPPLRACLGIGVAPVKSDTVRGGSRERELARERIFSALCGCTVS